MLSQHLACPFFDTDEIIAVNSKKSVRELYESKGAGEFMLAEEKVCAFLENKCAGLVSVIATGGGICENAPALNKLRTLGRFVFLEVPEERAANRIIAEAQFTPSGPRNLPAFISAHNPKNEGAVRKIFHDFYELRNHIYKTIADVTVEMEDAAPNVNFTKLSEALHV